MDKRTYRLRPLAVKDAERMNEWMHDEDVMRFMRMDGSKSTVESARAFIERSADESVNVHRAIVDGEDTYMGTVSLKEIEGGRAEYAICLHSDAIGKGAAADATDGILNVAFDELGLDEVYLNVRTDNVRAWLFYEKYGFVYTHTTPENINGEAVELKWYTAKREK